MQSGIFIASLEAQIKPGKQDISLLILIPPCLVINQGLMHPLKLLQFIMSYFLVDRHCTKLEK